MTRTIRRAAILQYASKQGIQSNVLLALWRFLPKRKYSGCVTEDGQKHIIGAACLCLVPGQQTHIALSDAFASIERWLRSVALMDLTRMILSRELLFPRLRSAYRIKLQTALLLHTEQGVDLRVISAMTPYRLGYY